MRFNFSPPRRLLIAACVAGGTALAGLPAAAQTTWPTKPVKIIVPFAPGGTTDILARAVAPELTKAFGQPFVVETARGLAAMWAPTQWPKRRPTATRC